MSVELRPAGPADAEAVAAFLHRGMNAKIPEERWRRLFAPPWPLPPDIPDMGWLAEDGGRVVGFIGRLWSERRIDGRAVRVANVTSWYLDKEHRNGRWGLALYRAVLDRLDDAPHTAISIARRTYPLYDRWGFGLLDDRRLLWRAGIEDGGGKVEILADRDAFDGDLTDEQRRLLDDHAGLPVSPVLARDDNGACLLVLSIKKKGPGTLFHDVLHVGDPAFLAAHAAAVADALLPPGDCVLASDGRFLDGLEARPAETVRLPVPRRFIGGSVAARRLDFLYSEVPLLDLKLD